MEPEKLHINTLIAKFSRTLSPEQVDELNALLAQLRDVTQNALRSQLKSAENIHSILSSIPFDTLIDEDLRTELTPAVSRQIKVNA